MNKNSTILLILLVGLCLGACNKAGQLPTLKNSTGNAGEMVIVINTDVWNSETGKLMKDFFSQEQLGLPQGEPIFDVINVPTEAFGNIFKTTRNLVLTKINPSVTEPSISYQKNVYANNQSLVTISAKNQQEFSDLLKKNGDKMIGFFLKAERDRIILNYTNFNEKAISNKTEELFGFKLAIPPGYNVIEATDSFLWIRYETPEISQGILVYSYPYTSDSTFTQNSLLVKRNIVLKKNVPGPAKGSYMSTERDALPIVTNPLKFKTNYAVEMRGLWKLENDFMGGPFVSLSILDLLKKRVVVLDGYVYAPSKDKRNFIRQVEAIIYSAQFTNQEAMDKLNKQFEE